MTVRIESVTMEDVCREVVKAAADVLKSHGFERPSVVVNFVWKDGGQQYAIGTAVPRQYRSMMADSLTQSVEEARS